MWAIDWEIPTNRESGISWFGNNDIKKERWFRVTRERRFFEWGNLIADFTAWERLFKLQTNCVLRFH